MSSAALLKVSLVPDIRAARGIRESIYVIFVGDEVVIEVLDAVDSWLKVRHREIIQLVQVRHELVSIVSYFESVGLKCSRVQTTLGIQADQERIGVGDRFCPVVFCLLVTKELAPFKHARVDEIPVESAPELFLTSCVWCDVPSSIVRSVPEKVQAQDASSTKAGAT